MILSIVYRSLECCHFIDWNFWRIVKCSKFILNANFAKFNGTLIFPALQYYRPPVYIPIPILGQFSIFAYISSLERHLRLRLALAWRSGSCSFEQLVNCRRTCRTHYYFYVIPDIVQWFLPICLTMSVTQTYSSCMYRQNNFLFFSIHTAAYIIK